MFKSVVKKNGMLTLEDWLRDVEHVRDPQVLSNVLLSDCLFTDKVKILISLPKKAIGDIVGMRILESRLEDSGHQQLAQLVRWLSFWDLPKRKLKWSLTWSDLVVLWDTGMRRAVQREVFVQEEVRSLRKSLALSEDDKRQSTQLSAYEAELDSLNREYWRFSSVLGKLEGEVPPGILSKAFKLCRTDPNWYLCLWLRKDCARRGGCCGRNCGCCEKVRTTKRRWNRGHCTSVCGCYIRTHGRSDINAKKSELEDINSFRITYNMSHYSARINRAYVWGLSFLDELDLYF